MEYVEEDERHGKFYHDGIIIARHSVDRAISIGEDLRLVMEYGRCFYCDGSNGCSIDPKEYHWVMDLYAIANKYRLPGPHRSTPLIVEGELLDKCLDLYYLMKYRHEKTITDIYNDYFVTYFKVLPSHQEARDEIWRNAFPSKMKSALSHSDYN
jgi:hypothetical protein